MANANDGHVTHPLSSQKADWQIWCDQIDNFVELHYGKVMPRSQRDMVKAIAKGDDVSESVRPFIRTLCTRTAREVVAVLGQKPW